MDHAVTKLRNETNMEPMTTDTNCAARSEFIGGHQASVSRCGVWANVASPLMKKKKKIHLEVISLKWFCVTLLSSHMCKYKFNEIWLENGAFFWLCRSLFEKRNFEAR